MARTPKAPPPPAPVRRGRKPKAEPGELALAVGGGAGDAEPAEAPPDEAPARSKPGRKPKMRPEAALPAVDEPPAMSVDQPGAMPEPAPGEDDAMIAEMAGPVSAGDGESADTNAMPPASGPGGSEPLQPAAWWDRASDQVRFDWPAIEHTASQEGPNQAMAKLLVAARAEGAHSRWPL